MAADITVPPPPPAALADEAMRLVGDDPRRALALADEALAAARRARDGVTVSRARRVKGAACRELGDLDGALTELRAAVRAAERAGSPQAAAEARISLVAALTESGRFAAALRQASVAVATANGVVAARALAQRGLVLYRAGRFEDAVNAYRKALPVLRRHGDRVWEARLLNNRGLAHAYRGALALAEADLTRAEKLYVELDQRLRAADACWNLGFVAARAGDIPAALSRYDDAAARFAAQGVPATEVLLDRGEVLASAGLFGEAQATIERALRGLENGAGTTLQAEAQLAFAQAALGNGDMERAAESAREALRLFDRQGRRSWGAVAQYVLLRCEERAGGHDGRMLDRALQTSDLLHDAGWRMPELDARIIAARIALELGENGRAREQLATVSQTRHHGTPELRIRAWYAEAMLRLSDGNPSGADRALRQGLQALDRYRATLGATELRVNTATHGTDLARLGLRSAFDGGQPRRVLAWVERWRAGALRWRPARPPAQAALATAVAELRRLSAEEELRRLDGRDARALGRQRAELERQVRGLTRHAVGRDNATTPAALDIARLVNAVGDRALVEYFTMADTLHAVTVAGGRVRLHALGAATDCRRQLDAARFGLRRLATGLVGGRDGANAAIAAATIALDKLLLGGLDRVIGDRELVVVPPGFLQGMPWSLLPGCAGRPISVAPSAASWLRAVEQPLPAMSGRAALVCGPDLPAGEEEVALLRSAYPAATTLTGADATADRVLAAVDGASFAHIAAHGQVRPDNPLFSALGMADGPLTVYDLERLGQAPAFVLLSACQSGVTATRPGDETLGLAAALLSLGTRSLIATVVPVPDQATSELMTEMHRRLRTGAAPAVALAGAQTYLRERDVDGTHLVASAGFACFGAS